jgi:hypothetical protein
VALGFGRWRVHLFRCRADHLRRDSWLRERVMVERTQPNSEPSPQGLQVIDAPRASPVTETATPWPPLKKALWDVLMAEQLNDGHYIKAFDLIEKLYAAAVSSDHAQCQQEPVATVTDLRCAIDTAYSIANGSFPPFNVAEEIAAHILRKFDVRPKGSAADTSTDREGK